jgi:glycosyltransferase involved in cell wall biosynthesis
MKPHHIILFADRLPPLTGGMEMHGHYFIEYFTNHADFPLSSVITKNSEGEDCVNLASSTAVFRLNPKIVFFNSGRWIEELPLIRQVFPKATFFYRTGGNEILMARLIKNQIPDHSQRQSFWVETINRTIDVLITNSAYTEQRLWDLGITCRFERYVGGVNTAALKCVKQTARNPLTIFCAARFVPYKNHALLLSIIHELVLRGYPLKLRLAGDGPLLAQAKEQVEKADLTSVVEFLGVLENEKTCQEIAQADLYMQLSTDVLTEVPGGSYVHSEGMGRSILEALTAGTYVIAGHCGALSEIVTPDRGVLLKVQDDVETMVNQVEEILRNLPARQPFIEDYAWEKLFKRYEGLFHENTASH